jgi:SHS2 domain-containing protein
MTSKKGYKYVSHTADVEFVAFGGTIETAFGNAALALFDTIADIKALKKDTGRVYRIKINISANNIEDLLWKMLQYCLSASDSKGLFCYELSKPKIKKNLSKFALSATAFGKKKNVEASELEVKGISKYRLKIARRNNRFRISVVVDV